LLSASSSQHRMALPARIKISIYGDSIIQGFPIHALLPQGGVIENRGMVGDSVEHIEARFQQSQSESDLVILEGGINNIVRGEARHETDHDIIPPIVATERRMVAEAKRRNSKVMIVTVHPVTKRSLLHHFHSPFSFSVLPSHFDVARVNTLVLNLNKAL